MIKKFETTCITMGDGNTVMYFDCNCNGEGLVRMFDTKQGAKPRTTLDKAPSDINEEFPDCVMLFRSTKDIDIHIKKLKELKTYMKECKEEIKTAKKEKRND